MWETFSVGQILKMPGEESQSLQTFLLYALLVNILKPARVCQCGKLAGLRPEVSQTPGTAVWPQLRGPTWEQLCVRTVHLKLQS